MRVRSLLLAAVILSSCRGATESADRAAITVAGSDTEVSLAQRFAEAFSGSHEMQVSVRGGGSGAGIAALLEGRVDIATSSRPLKSEERERASRAGIELIEKVVAIDALAVIVHRDNPLSAIDLATLSAVYRGEIERWTDLNGIDEPITLYGRQSNSGTYDYFRSAVLKNDYSLRMMNLNGNAQIVEGVRNDRNGIGYVGIGYVRDLDVSVKILQLVDEGRRVDPRDEDAISKGRYPVARPLFMFTTATALPRVEPFLDSVTTEAGERAIRAEGFLPPRSDS